MMAETRPQNRQEIAGGIIIGLTAIGLLIGHWQYGVNWQNPAILSWLIAVTAVCLGLGLYAFGLVSGDYHQHQSTYLRLLRLFGAIALVAGSSFSIFVFIF
jgi:hypothetical protein